ncbi:MAG: hypothetical protein ACE5JI_04580 [Acidobacteriota bacterium]
MAPTGFMGIIPVSRTIEWRDLGEGMVDFTYVEVFPDLGGKELKAIENTRQLAESIIGEERERSNVNFSVDGRTVRIKGKGPAGAFAQAMIIKFLPESDVGEVKFSELVIYAALGMANLELKGLGRDLQVVRAGDLQNSTPQG